MYAPELTAQRTPSDRYGPRRGGRANTGRRAVRAVRVGRRGRDRGNALPPGRPVPGRAAGAPGDGRRPTGQRDPDGRVQLGAHAGRRGARERVRARPNGRGERRRGAAGRRSAAADAAIPAQPEPARTGDAAGGRRRRRCHPVPPDVRERGGAVPAGPTPRSRRMDGDGSDGSAVCVDPSGARKCSRWWRGVTRTRQSQASFVSARTRRAPTCAASGANSAADRAAKRSTGPVSSGPI